MQAALALVLCLLSVQCAVAEAFVPVRATATRIDQFGDIVFDVKKTDLDQAGLEYGDSVDFRFSGGYEIKAVPYFSDFYGRKGTAILAFYMDEVVLGSVASNLNLVVGIEPGETAIMTLAQRGRYREEYKAYNINDARYRMEGQTDAAFINAREVTAGGIRPGRLYRGSTPFDPAFGRIELMGSYIEAHSIGGILNLANGQAEMKTGEGLPDYTSDMIEQGRVLTCHLGVDYTEPAAMRSIGEGLDRLMELEGPWLIHCSLGRDRTGVICAVVEALCGATYDEIVQDYMISYDLLHNIDMNPESLQYRLFKMRIDDILAAIFGTEIEALPGIDLRLAARDYLMRCGMTGDKIDKLERLLISD
ncbi:MAG: tyrosine-protein phosphatase [Clostridia bacterium]|jgi:hypothetical protein|nr:tyrosine-protein phosphatase [Clostridia bacterium]